MRRQISALFIASVLGLFAILLPVVVSPPAQSSEAPLFPLLATAVEKGGLAQIALLLVVGLVLGATCRVNAFLLGVAAVALLPLAAIAEMIADSTSHNLFPLEFCFYALDGCVVALGALIASRVFRHRHVHEAAPRTS